MTKRSSLDPIAEAQARVWLRYNRARKARLPGKPLGGIAARVARSAGTKPASPISQLKARWREIAGDTLYKYCRPEKITGSPSGRTLVLRVIPAAAPMVQHQSETIRQRVSVAAGGDIDSLKLVHGTLQDGAETKNPKPPLRTLSAKERSEIKEKAAQITDPELRAAIVALGTAMLSRQKT